MAIHFIKVLKTVEKKIALRGREEEIKSSLIGVDEEEVPKGCLAVYVGIELRRFVIPTAYLRSPEFEEMLEKMEEEFGFDQKGGLRIPGEEEDFEKMINILYDVGSIRETKKKKKKRNMRVRDETL